MEGGTTNEEMTHGGCQQKMIDRLGKPAMAKRTKSMGATKMRIQGDKALKPSLHNVKDDK